MTLAPTAPPLTAAKIPAGVPVRDVKTVCPYCGVGCGMVLRVEQDRVIKVTGDRDHPANFGRLCTKGASVAATLQTPDRLAHAFMRSSRSAERQPVALREAIRATAGRLQRIIAEHGPDAVALYVSGQLSLEAQYLANKLCKGYLRTNNIDSNSRLCMASAASGYKLSLGADGPTGSYGDIERADCFFAIGANMAECHPILFLRVLDRCRQGAKLIVVDPRRTPTAEKANLFLPIRPGTDLALLNGLLHLIHKNGHTDPEFIRRHTENWESLEVFLAGYPPARVAEWTGLAEADLHRAAQWIGESAEVMSFWTMGLNQSTHGTWHTNALCNLHLATGKICRPGSGPFSLTGQPNAMGGREVGYMSHALPGQRQVTSRADRTYMEHLWDVPAGTIPAQPGLDAVALFQKLAAGTVKAVWVIGTNPVASMPRRQRVIDGLNQAALVIVQDAYHPTETSRHADILLPGAVWAEAEGVMVNSERNVTLMQAAVSPPGEARADWWIVAQVAQAMGFVKPFNYADASEVFDEIRRTWNGKTGYDLQGISYASLRQASRRWPCAPGQENGDPIRYLTAPAFAAPSQSPRAAWLEAVRFPTDSGKAQFFTRPCLAPAAMPDASFPMVMMTGRVAHQWHTRTKTGKVDSLNKLNPGPFVEMHPEDAQLLGIAAGALVQVRSAQGFALYPAVLTTRVRPGNCFAPIHWNDQFGENLAVNAATSEAVDPISLQPEFKFTAVSLSAVRLPATSDFTPAQQALLKTFLTGFTARAGGKNVIVPVIPETAPFSGSQREQLNQMLRHQLLPGIPPAHKL